MGKQNNIITLEILILAMRFMEQKVFFFFFDVEPISVMSRPGSAMTLFDGLFLKCVRIITGLKIVVSFFQRDFFIDSEVIAFFVQTDFHPFYMHF